MLFGEWDMNEAMEVSKQEGFTMGIRIGEQRGEQRGRTEGIQIGEQRGIRETLIKSIRAVCDILSPEQLAERFQLTLEEVHHIINEPDK